MTTYDEPASHASARARSIGCSWICFITSSSAGRRLRPAASRASVSAASAAHWLPMFINFRLDRLHRTHAHDLHDDVFVLGAVVMMESRRMEHHAAGLDRDHLVGLI